MDEAVKVARYADIDIFVDTHGHFICASPIPDDDDLIEERLSDLKEKLDRRIERLAKSPAPKMTAALLTSEGEPVTARSVHAARGILLTTPSSDSYQYYPDTPAIRSIIAATAAAKAEVSRLEGLLEPFEITSRRSYSRHADQSKLIRETESEVAEKRAAALKVFGDAP